MANSISEALSSAQAKKAEGSGGSRPMAKGIETEVTAQLPSRKRAERRDQATRVAAIMARAANVEDIFGQLPGEVKGLIEDQAEERGALMEKLSNRQLTPTVREGLQRAMRALNEEFVELLDARYKSNFSDDEKETAKRIARVAFFLLMPATARTFGDVVQLVASGNEYTGIVSGIQLGVFRDITDAEQVKVATILAEFEAEKERFYAQSHEEQEKGRRPVPRLPSWYVKVGNRELALDEPARLAEQTVCSALGLDPRRQGVSFHIRQALKRVKADEAVNVSEQESALKADLQPGDKFAILEGIRAGEDGEVLLTDPGEAKDPKDPEKGWHHGGRIRVKAESGRLSIVSAMGNEKGGRQWPYPNADKIVGTGVSVSLNSVLNETSVKGVPGEWGWLLHKVLRRTLAKADNAAEKRQEGLEELQADFEKALEAGKELRLRMISENEFKAGKVGATPLSYQGRWSANKHDKKAPFDWNPVLLLERTLEERHGQEIRRIVVRWMPARIKSMPASEVVDVPYNEFDGSNVSPFSGVGNSVLQRFLKVVASPPREEAMTNETSNESAATTE